MVWVASKRSIAKAAPSGAARRKPTPRSIAVVLFIWVALAGAWVFLKLGPLATTPASARDWVALALACGVIATLVVLLVKAILETRRTATKHGGDSVSPRRRQD